MAGLFNHFTNYIDWCVVIEVHRMLKDWCFFSMPICFIESQMDSSLASQLSYQLIRMKSLNLNSKHYDPRSRKNNIKDTQSIGFRDDYSRIWIQQNWRYQHQHPNLKSDRYKRKPRFIYKMRIRVFNAEIQYK